MSDPYTERDSVKPFEDADEDPPVPESEPSRTTEEAGRRDMAIRGAAAGGALSGAAGYAGGAMAGTGGAIGARLTDADADTDEVLGPDRPESNAAVSRGPADTPGIDGPASAGDVAEAPGDRTEVDDAHA
jgi:hypothetical protein